MWVRTMIMVMVRVTVVMGLVVGGVMIFGIDGHCRRYGHIHAMIDHEHDARCSECPTLAVGAVSPAFSFYMTIHAWACLVMSNYDDMSSGVTRVQAPASRHPMKIL